MNIKHQIVTTVGEFVRSAAGWIGPIACDTETYGKRAEGGKLLGVSLSPAIEREGTQAIYIPIVQYNHATKQFDAIADQRLINRLHSFFAGARLIGHNFTYDKGWIDDYFLINTNWIFDTRIGWHMASAPAGPRPYGLKDAQKELLGWEDTNERDLQANVASYGGKLTNGDHYMADLPILARYAALDAYSTACVYRTLEPWYKKHAYMPLLRSIMAYNQLLERNTTLGIAVDREGLQKAHNRLIKVRDASKKRFLRSIKQQVEELEHDWRDIKIASLQRQSAKDTYLASPERWERFNLNSDKHKRELFYGKLGLEPKELTAGGLPATSADALKQACDNNPLLESYLKYEKANTLTTSFTSAYLGSLDGASRLHPGFNICGTVSYRLSGFKPYLLNAPFDEKAIMRHLRLDPGEVGVHADLAAIEPTLTAHYSEDSSLLKVFRDGLGDIYLDLALELFPKDTQLHDLYDPKVPIDKKVKEALSKQRKIAKVIQLAVQYTGTGHTVAKNLTKQGIPTTLFQAEGYVLAYWRKFIAVKRFNDSLREVNRRDGMLRNVIGRIIRVPDPDYKDLPNRFIQSGAHDVLMLWVLRIYEKCKEYGIPIRPVLLDCHDSTSNATDAANGPTLMAIYDEALAEINKELGLCVTIKAESKFFSTLAGLKNDE